jgi:hypothetical protein
LLPSSGAGALWGSRKFFISLTLIFPI